MSVSAPRRDMLHAIGEMLPAESKKYYLYQGTSIVPFIFTITDVQYLKVGIPKQGTTSSSMRKNDSVVMRNM